MTNSKSTKRSLLASSLSLLLCFTMLLSTTFAWFTDTVASTNNIIKSGNLDVELYYQTEGQTDWTKVTEDTNLFKKDALWEPGHTEVVRLKVVNEGSLALKYQLGVNVASETGSKNVKGEDLLLSHHIKYGFVDGADTYTRTEAIAAVESKAYPLSTAFTSETTELLPLTDTNTDNENIVTMVAYMPTAVGNEANHGKGEVIPTINLGINLVATQFTYEEDTFDNQYDVGSELPRTIDVEGSDKKAIVDAINSAKPGDTIKLTEDTTVAGYGATNKLVVEKEVVIDLNGKTITTECGWGGIDLKGGASIINGTINHTGNTAAIKAFQVDKIENVIINVTETAGKTKGGIVVQDGASHIGSIKNVTINGATNGIECYRSTGETAIGSIENVVINATKNGIYLNGAGNIGSISDCKITADEIGINAYLANLWHISLDIKNSEIAGGTSGIDIWDEGKTNTGSTVTFNYDDATSFKGSENNIKVTLQEEIFCTINGVAQSTPCDVRIND